MNHRFNHPYNRIVIAFILSLSGFLLLLNVLFLSEQRTILTNEATHHAQKKLQLLESLILDSLVKNDYGAIETSLHHWSTENRDVLSLQAIASNGFKILEYHKNNEHKNMFAIHSEHTFRYMPGHSLTLKMTENFPHLEEIIQNLFIRYFAFSFTIIVLFGAILWFSFYKLALLPAKKHLREIDNLNRNLEEKVKEKTRELVDINENLEQRVEEEIKKQRSQEQLLIQQSRLAAMGEMIGAIAHQWRQPLTVLSLHIQNIQDVYENEKIDQEYIDSLVSKSMKNIQYMSRTIDDFRNFFAPSKHKTVFNIPEAVQEILNILYPTLKNNNVHLDLSCSVTDETGHTDKVFLKDDAVLSESSCIQNPYLMTNGYSNEFKQVIINIISNAKDAIKQCIEEKNLINGEGLIVIRYSLQDENILIEIEDNGGGIPEKMRERIFDPYFTTKGPDKGTGIGLFMSKTIIEKNMGGQLSVENTKAGACFTISLKQYKTLST